MMDKDYICKKNKIKDAIDEIDNFITLMTNFNNKHNNTYSYTIDIKEIEDKRNKWLIELKVKR